MAQTRPVGKQQGVRGANTGGSDKKRGVGMKVPLLQARVCVWLACPTACIIVASAGLLCELSKFPKSIWASLLEVMHVHLAWPAVHFTMENISRTRYAENQLAINLHNGEHFKYGGHSEPSQVFVCT